MNKEWEQNSDEESVIFNTGKTRRYAKKGQCKYLYLKTNELLTVPSATGFHNTTNERLMNGHLSTAVSHNNYQDFSHYPGCPQSPSTNFFRGRVHQEQYVHIHNQMYVPQVGEETKNSSPITSLENRTPSGCIQLTKQPMNYNQHGNKERYQEQHWEKVKGNRHFDGYIKCRQNKLDNQESKYERDHAALVFRGFSNRYSNQKIQKDVLKKTHLGLSVFLMENETLILKNAWQREIIPGQKMADKFKAPMTVVKVGSISDQSPVKGRTLSPQKIVMDGISADSNTVPEFLGFRTLNFDKSGRNDNVSDSSIDDNLSNIEELGEILEETFIDMSQSIQGKPESNYKALTEGPVNLSSNEYETSPVLCPVMTFGSVEKSDRSQSSDSQSEAIFSVPEPEGRVLDVEIPDVALEDTEDMNKHLRCRKYLTDLKCSRGDYCSFLHILPKTDNVICKEFQLGKCSRTAAVCLFKHPCEKIIVNTDSFEESPLQEDSVGTLPSLLKTGQKTAAAMKANHHSQVSSLEFIGKLKISKPKPVGTPRRKTSERDACSVATSNQGTDNHNQIAPVIKEVQNNNRTVFKTTCSTKSLFSKETCTENSKSRIGAVPNNGSLVNTHKRTETSVSENVVKNDQDQRECKENRSVVELKKVRKENQVQEKKKTTTVRNESSKGSNSFVSCNVTEIKSLFVDMKKINSSTGTLSRKNESFTNKTVSNRDGSTTTVLGREKDKQRNKYKKKKKSEKLSFSNSSGHGGKQKGGIYDENNAYEFNLREEKKNVNNGEDLVIIKNSHGSCNVQRREKDKERSKQKKKENFQVNDDVKGKSGTNDVSKFSLREKENQESDKRISEASEHKHMNSSQYRLIEGFTKDFQDVSNKSSTDVDEGKKSLDVPTDWNEKNTGSEVKHLKSEGTPYKSSDPYEKEKKAKRRRTDESALVSSDNMEHPTKALELSDENSREMRGSQNFKSCNLENNLNGIMANESASDDNTPTFAKTEPGNVSVFTSYPVNESVVENFVQYFTLDVKKSKDVVKTETFELRETSDTCKQYRKKVYILTMLTKQWLHDVDENYRSSGDPFDDICKVIQEMGLEIWYDGNYPDVYIWEVNMRRMFVSLYTSLDLEAFTKDIHKVMKNIPDIYDFFSFHKNI
ncbi:uncharacterized protein [Panulirus ornatus]|uniref:uncharacterized protein n=1 Tax=Panulirus ornatus TaxID=150431 RepID=UPI003A83A7AD